MLDVNRERWNAEGPVILIILTRVIRNVQLMMLYHKHLVVCVHFSRSNNFVVNGWQATSVIIEDEEVWVMNKDEALMYS